VFTVITMFLRDAYRPSQSQDILRHGMFLKNVVITVDTLTNSVVGLVW
jgi:hypothetical protein